MAFPMRWMQCIAPPCDSEPVKDAPSTSGDGQKGIAADGEPGDECPICLMFKEGGCKQQFDDFMDCGIEAEKGKRDYQDCVKMVRCLSNQSHNWSQ